MTSSSQPSASSATYCLASMRRLWFRADRVGTYHLFCAQFCGTDHSNMIGDVVVMAAKDYADWLTVERRRRIRWRTRARTRSSAMAAPAVTWAVEPCVRPRWQACMAARYRCPMVQHGHRRRSLYSRFDHVSRTADRRQL